MKTMIQNKPVSQLYTQIISGLPHLGSVPNNPTTGVFGKMQKKLPKYNVVHIILCDYRGKQR